MAGKHRTDSGCGAFVKWSLVIFNIFFVLCGITLIGIGVWIAIDRNFLSDLLGTELYESAAYLLMAVGIIVTVIAFFGCCGAKRENKCLLVVFLIFIVILFLILVVAAAIAVIFQDRMGDTMKAGMKKTLVDWYGPSQFKVVTDAWDAAQTRLECCGVDNEGWGLYNQTLWIKEVNPGMSHISPFYKYVPESCCVRDHWGNVYDLKQCQESRVMPPGTNIGGYNDAVFYRGCYDAGYEFLMKHATIILGLGFAVAVLLLLGIIFAAVLLRYIRDE